jgi:tetratricopeptide (TPR) repeat protein
MVEGGRDEHRLPGSGSFVCQGDYWTVSYEHRLIRLRDSKGLRQLALLLREPGREFHVLDLVARIDPAEIDGNGSRTEPEELAKLTVRSALGEDGGEPVDAQARAAYKQRLVELTEELEAARKFHDDGRVTRIEDEIDIVERALKDAFGLGGRSRKARSAADQARVNVTKNIGRALDQIEAKHDSLGRLLKSSIKTGIFCSYQPDPSYQVAWSFEAEQPPDAISSAESDGRSGGARLDAPPSNQKNLGRQPAAGRLVWGQFIGRVEEIAALRTAIGAALGGQASLVMVVGEPGIGKTRLVEEAGEYARRRGVRVLVGHCYEGEAASPYSPFVEAIREYVSTRPEEALNAEMGDGAADLAKLVPEIRTRFPDLAASQAPGQEVERMRLFDSIVSFLLNASKIRPIMLALEDLHWADKASLQLLQHLARRFKGSRLAVVGTYRDVEVDRGHPLSAVLANLRRERLYERVLLRGLSESEVKQLIEAIAGCLGENFVSAVLRETEGNPFFIEETLRHLVDIGSLYRHDGKWITDAKAIADLGVPEGVRDMIGRRLSRLSETTNRLLRAAAVLGREFEFEVLGHMSELVENAMVPAVEEGLSNRILVESRGGNRQRYAFTHALVRQTLIEELSPPRRHLLHLKAAQAIEAVHELNLEPHVAAVANHYRMAGFAAEKTIEYSIRAGSAAYAVFAYEEAGAHWRTALELMDEQGGGDRKRRAELLWLLGDELVSSGPKAVEYLEAAAPLFEGLGDNNSACDAYLRLTLYLATDKVGTIDVRRAMPHFKKAETLMVGQPESPRQVHFYFSMVGAYMFALRRADGLVAAKRAMEICDRLGLDGLWCVAAALLCQLLVHSGSLSEGLRLADQARHRADRINDTMVGYTVALSGGSAYRLLRNPREAQDWYTSELAKPRTAQAGIPRASLLSGLAKACIEAGEFTQARAHLAQVNAKDKPEELLFFEGDWELLGKMLTAQYERVRTTGSLQQEMWLELDLARLHRFTGERAQAVQAWQRALQINVDAGIILFEMIARAMLATMAADAGYPGAAMPHLQRCRQILSAGENWFGVAGNVERAAAVVAAAQHECSVAEAHFEKAIATFQRYCLLWEEADTLQYWGRALLAAGERTRAIEKFDAAIEIYRSRGAGTRFLDYVMADKTRAQDPKSNQRAI